MKPWIPAGTSLISKSQRRRTSVATSAEMPRDQISSALN
jgi:hypothetical protein